MLPPVDEYDEADQALSVGRNNLVRRELSELRREHEGGGMSEADCARRVVEGRREIRSAASTNPTGA